TNYLETGEAKIIGVGREVEAVTKDGRRLPVFLQISTIEVQGETRFVGFITDLSERKELEEQLRRSQRLEALGSLAGGIAHDFNNIIAPILGQTEVLMRSTDVDRRVKERLESLRTSALRAKDLVKRILAFSRPMVGDRSPVNLYQMAAETRELLREVLPTSLVIELEGSENVRPVLAVATEIHQVILNLVTNAHQAIEGEQGYVRIGVRNGLLKRPVVAMRLAAKQPGAIEAVVLTVEDNGAGIPDGVVERIFDPFFTTKQQNKGTGLGLATVHRIVTGLGGTISVESQVGIGTKFVVTLPAISGNFNAPVESDTDRVTARKDLAKILYVDDEVQLTAITDDMLTMLGYMPTCVNDPREALALVREDPKKWDLILTDQTMPHMFGTDLAKELRRMRDGPPVAICTGLVHDPKILGLASGVIEGVLAKPVSMDDLAEFLDEVLRRCRERD
ncbi:MAG: response regulator, partial [Planctomycetes bacterium]|nr:response regulator [Planctomycetota bacterium]